jgi:hypothetical protein
MTETTPKKLCGIAQPWPVHSANGAKAMADIHKLRPQGGGSTRSSAPLDLIDALNDQVTFCRGVIDAFQGVAYVTDTEKEMQGAFAVAEAHYAALKAIARIAAGKAPDDDDDTEGDAS